MDNKDDAENLGVNAVSNLVASETEMENEEFKQKSNDTIQKTYPEATENNNRDALEERAALETADESPNRHEPVQPVLTHRPRRSSRLERDYKDFNTYGYGK